MQRHFIDCYATYIIIVGDFHSFDLKGTQGQLMRFYGNECMHYTTENTTPVTRVSFDFRVIPAKLFTNVTQQHIASSLLPASTSGQKRKSVEEVKEQGQEKQCDGTEVKQQREEQREEDEEEQEGGGGE